MKYLFHAEINNILMYSEVSFLWCSEYLKSQYGGLVYGNKTTLLWFYEKNRNELYESTIIVKS